VGTGASVAGGIGVNASVGGTGVEAGAQPLSITVSNANAWKIDPIDFFMTLSPFELIRELRLSRFLFALWHAGVP
jgi:hypothetical protein